MRRLGTCSLLIAASLFVFNVLPMMAQVRPGSISLGISGGASKYYGEFTDDLFGLSGEFQAMYTPWKYLNVGLGVSLSDLQWRVTPSVIDRYPDYFGPGAQVGDLYPGTLAQIENRSETRASAYEVLLAVNLLPDEIVVPYIGAGAGLLTWSPTNAREHTALPNNSAGVYDRMVGVFPVFAGFNWYITDDISLGARASYRFTLTPYLDDLQGPGAPYDEYATITGGIAFHLLGDRDKDNDGLEDAEERRIGSREDRADSDGDGMSDYEEVRLHGSDPTKTDTDGDNLTDFEEVTYFHSSPVKVDTDGDGVTDEIEVSRGSNPRSPDSDNDGLNDHEEITVHRTDPAKADTDDDGLTDFEETRSHGTNPLKVDTDGDGLVDGEEVADHRSNPLLADTDRDGLTDGEEVLNFRTDPTKADTDNDRLLDGEEVIKYKTDPLLKDTDHDGLSDADELSCRYQTSPLNPDTDGDGVIDPRDKTPAQKCEGCGGTGIPPYTSPEATDKPVEPQTPPPVSTPPPATSPKKKFAKDIRFKLNTDEFDMTQPETEQNLGELLDYMQESCDEIQVMIEGHASSEGPAERNRELSELRARRVQAWLIEQGIPPSKIRGAIGYGSSQPRVREPSAAAAKRMSREQLESIRRLNRRIEVAILKECTS